MFEPIVQNIIEEEETGSVSFNGFPKGLNSKMRASMLAQDELAACLNYMFRPQGKLVTRPAIKAITDTAIGIPHDRKTAALTSGQYVFSSDKDGKVYYDVGNTPTLIGTVAAAPFLFPYKGAMLVCDGSFLKYCDTVDEIKMAYDAGDDGRQYSNWDEGSFEITDDGGLAVSTKIGARFTTEAWDAGYTMPITQVAFKAKGTTSAAAITVRLRTTAGVLMAEKEIKQTIETASAAYYYAVFTADDITTEMDSETSYDCLIEGVDFELQYHTVASGGVLYNNDVNDPTKNPIMKVYPGVPPKASFVGLSGKDSSSRLFLYNPDEPGRAYFCNLSFKDWSTDDGGGWVGVVDNDKNSYEIGAFGFLYGVFYIYGTAEYPYTCVLTGATPNAFVITPLFQHATATFQTLINTNDDLWNASSSGIDHLKGVQESGDVRQHSISERVADKFEDYWGLTAFAGYNPKYGHYMLQLPGSDTVLVGHTKMPFSEVGEVQRVGFPWSEFELPVTPTYFSHFEEEFTIGANDGLFYTFDAGMTKDFGTTQPTFDVRTASVKTAGEYINLDQIQVSVESQLGVQLDYAVYINNNNTDYALLDTIELPMSGDIIVDDLDIITVDEWLSTIDPIDTPSFYPINIFCFALQVRILNVNLTGQPTYIDGFSVKLSEV